LEILENMPSSVGAAREPATSVSPAKTEVKATMMDVVEKE
jgi:hypothetical protein